MEGKHHPISPSLAVLTSIGCLLIFAATAPAQFTANYQTNTISNVTSNWVGNGTYVVGSNTFADVLLIQSSGVLSNGSGCLGYVSSNNTAQVTGNNSVWYNDSGVYVGYIGWANSLIISGGGRVENSSGYVGYGTYGSSNNSVLVTDSGSVWSNASALMIGNGGAGNSLVISNQGQVMDASGYIGQNAGASGNTAVITGSGSAWHNSSLLAVGDFGAGNTLVVTDGGRVDNSLGIVGLNPTSSNNAVLVSGNGSVWSNGSYLSVGNLGSGNSLVISNSGQVVDGSGYLGYNSASSSNTVLVADGGIWQNGSLYAGYLGSGNSLVVDGGSVLATNLTMGLDSATCNNLVQLDSGSIIVTDAAHNAVLELRDGQLILNGGVVQADTLLITNTCAQFVHNGGSLVLGNVVLDPNFFRIVSVTQQSNDMLVTWMMGPGATNALQATAGDQDGQYGADGFTNIFVVTNNPSLGTVTNYLDLGAATNTPTRYYRVRLTP
ncbi:MAG: hypothetical protein ABSG14_12310 [Verrucomicrobiia bacterium]